MFCRLSISLPSIVVNTRFILEVSYGNAWFLIVREALDLLLFELYTRHFRFAGVYIHFVCGMVFTIVVQL